MKVFLTGATGFIGGNLARELVARGYEVAALVRPCADTHAIDGLALERVPGELRDVDSLRGALRGCEALFHVAAHYSFWVRDARSIYESNVTGTENVLMAALEAGVRKAVYTSSVAACGLPKNGTPGDENTAVDERFLYGHYKRSKYLAERAAWRIHARGLPLVVVCPSTPIGEGDLKPTPTGRIIVDFLRGRMPAYVDTGLNLVDVEDVATGHALALEKGRSGERYILGNENMTLRYMLSLLARVSGRPSPRFRMPRPLALTYAHVCEARARLTGGEPRCTVAEVRMSRHHMYFDASKAVRELGLPQTPVEQALTKAARWFRERGYA